MRKILFVFFAILSILAPSQTDTLVLLTGNKLPVKEYSKLENGMYRFEVIKKHKVKSVDFYPSELFVVKHQDGSITNLFREFYDKESGLNFTFDNAKEYVKGEIFARRAYKFTGGKIINFIIGAVAPVVSSALTGTIIFSPLLPFASAVIIGYVRNSPELFDKKFPSFKDNIFFKKGYIDATRIIKLSKGTKFSMIGLLTGTAVYVIVSKIL